MTSVLAFPTGDNYETFTAVRGNTRRSRGAIVLGAISGAVILAVAIALLAGFQPMVSKMPTLPHVEDA